MFRYRGDGTRLFGPEPPYCIALRRIALHYAMLHGVASLHIALHHTTLHHITLGCMAPRYIMSHRIASHDLCLCCGTPVPCFLFSRKYYTSKA